VTTSPAEASTSPVHVAERVRGQPSVAAGRRACAIQTVPNRGGGPLVTAILSCLGDHARGAPPPGHGAERFDHLVDPE